MHGYSNAFCFLVYPFPNSKNYTGQPMKRQRLFYKLGGKGKLQKSKFYLGQRVIAQNGKKFKVIDIVVSVAGSNKPTLRYIVRATVKNGLEILYGQLEHALYTYTEWRQLHPKKPKTTTETV